jgi:cytidine deaminase
MIARGPKAAESRRFDEALVAAENAYAPYSGYRVGAVAFGPSGRAHHGVNVESAAYPAGLCAERAALAALVAHGEHEVCTVAVAAADGSDCLPCGLCLQALAEFGDPELVVRIGGEVAVLRLSALLTAPFTLRTRAEDADEGRVAEIDTGSVGLDERGSHD